MTKHIYLYLGRFRMGLVLQETNVQVKYWSHTSLTKKQVKKCCSLKLNRNLDRILSIENYRWSSIEAWYKLYLSRIMKSDFSNVITRISLSNATVNMKEIKLLYITKNHNFLFNFRIIKQIKDKRREKWTGESH